MEFDIEFRKIITEKLKEKLPEERFRHVISVSDTAGCLALKYGYSFENALIAGLLHDCAKYMSYDEMLVYAASNDIILRDIEKDVPSLLHATIGYYVAKNEYGIENDEILDAILYHTTGRPAMTLIEQIIFIADYIEPNRNGILGLEEARKAAFYDLNECTSIICENTLAHLRKKGYGIDTRTIETQQYYTKQISTDLSRR